MGVIWFSVHHHKWISQTNSIFSLWCTVLNYIKTILWHQIHFTRNFMEFTLAIVRFDFKMDHNHVKFINKILNENVCVCVCVCDDGDVILYFVKRFHVLTSILLCKTLDLHCVGASNSIFRTILPIENLREFRPTS